MPRTRTTLVCLGVALAITAARALGDDPSASLLGRLGSDDYTVRRDATDELLQRDTVSDEQWTAWLRDAASLEQRLRLLDAAGHHFIRRLAQSGNEALSGGGGEGGGGGGSIGLSQRRLAQDQYPGLDQPAILVVKTFPGFPGYARLRPGDLILAMNGRRFGPQFAADIFSDQVKAVPAGNDLTLTIQRDSQTFDVHLRLARFNALQHMYDPADLDLRAQHAQQWLAARNALLRAAGLDPATALTHPLQWTSEPPDAASSPDAPA